MKVEDIGGDETVKAGNDDEREVYLSRCTMKIAVEGGESNLSLHLEKLRLVFKQM